MSEFLTWPNILMALGVLTGVAIWAYRTFSKQSAQLKLQRLILIQDVAQAAYLAVHGFAPSTATTLDDKVAEALKRVAETIAAQTGKPLTPTEKVAAVMHAQAAATKVALSSVPANLVTSPK